MCRIPHDGFYFCTDMEGLLDASLAEIGAAQFRGVPISLRVWKTLELLSIYCCVGKPLHDLLTKAERRKLLKKALALDRADWNRAMASPEARAAWEEVEKSRGLMSEEEVKEFQARSARGYVGRVYHLETKEGLFEMGRFPAGGTAEERSSIEARMEDILEVVPILRAAAGARAGESRTGQHGARYRIVEWAQKRARTFAFKDVWRVLIKAADERADVADGFRMEDLDPDGQAIHFSHDGEGSDLLHAKMVRNTLTALKKKSLQS